MTPTSSTDATPKVSVIMPAYNAGEYIAEAIESVKGQSFTDWELIVVDDGSTDNTAELASRYADGKKIKFISQPNQGPASARNHGVRGSRGNWIALLDADDIWYPQKLEKQFSLAVGRASFVIADLHLLKGSQKTSLIYSHDNPVDQTNPLQCILYRNNFIPTSVTFFSRKLFDQAGGFDEKLRGCEDLDLWVKFFELDADLVVIPEPLGIHRLTSSSASTNRPQMLWGNYMLLHNYRQRASDGAAKRREMEFLYEYITYSNREKINGFKERLRLLSLASRFGLLSKMLLKQFIVSMSHNSGLVSQSNHATELAVPNLVLATASDDFYANEVLNLIGSIKANSDTVSYTHLTLPTT